MKHCKQDLLAWTFSLFGLASLVWFLVRVIPKPSRAAYPCMRVAAPMASSFVIMLIGICSSVFALRKARRKLRESRYLIAALLAGAAVAVVWVGVFSLDGPVAAPRSGSSAGSSSNVTSGPNDPFGKARGANLGRVVWVHDPDATDWDGPGSGEHWWEGNHTDQAVVDQMVSNAIQWLAGKPSDVQAWSALFKHFNQERGKGWIDYQSGEKIAVKINLTTCNATGGGGSVDPNTGEKQYYLDKADTSMHVILALLRQLVNVVGVAQSDISVGDTLTRFPNQWYDHLAVEFPNVHYLDHYGTLPGRTPVAFSSMPLYWSTPDAAGKEPDFLPASFAGAAYFINLPVLKGHGAGITICSKNHYGSMIRSPVGQAWGGWKNYYDLHLELALPPGSYGQPGQGYYRPQVDMMGHWDLGGKTLLYLVDALYCGYYWEGTPYKWDMAPFNHDWPSSLFASQDGVAVDSVGHDFLNEEWPDVVSGGNGAPGSLDGGAEDYLHEAALAGCPPSGTFYDPESDATPMESLGVHEHWNNAVLKQYTRNLGTGAGIELISAEPPVSLDLAITSLPIPGSHITGTHPGTTDYLALAMDGSSISLTAPLTFAGPATGYLFNRWRLNGADQPAGLQPLSFDISLASTAEAIYDPFEDNDGLLHVPGEYPSIQDAVNIAVDSETVLVDPGTYVESLDFLGKAVMVRSSRGASSTIIEGNQAGSVVKFVNGEGPDSMLHGFLIRNGRALLGGGMHIDASSPSMISCIFSENSA
ncbi:MAG: DUF362 domain-containing protein, partial [Planctomycetota bacterium]